MKKRSSLRNWLIIFAICFGMYSAQVSHAAKRPDPVVATLMSIGATVIPLTLGTILWTQDRGINEGFRYDMGFVFFAIGGVLGPSTGKFYADQESDAWISMILRGLTSGIGLSGSALWLRGETAQTRNNGRALATIGISATGLLSIYDIWTAGSAALETQRMRGYGPGSEQSNLIDLQRRNEVKQVELRKVIQLAKASTTEKHLPRPQLQLKASTLHLLSQPVSQLRLVSSPLLPIESTYGRD